MNTLTIEPVEGRALPYEHQPRERITRRTTVPDTTYYRRAIDHGDATLVPNDEPKPKTPDEPETKTA